MWHIAQLSLLVPSEKTAALESPLNAVHHRRRAEAMYFRERKDLVHVFTSKTVPAVFFLCFLQIAVGESDGTREK